MSELAVMTTVGDASEAQKQAALLDAPIFLTGFARSGTTWVNRLFRDYFDAGFVNEGQFIVSFGKRLRRYGDLAKSRNKERLLHAMHGDAFFTILKSNYAIEINWEKVRQTESNFSAIVLEILRQIAQGLGKHRTGSKYPVFGRYMDLLNSLFPNCRIIHVVRDGRDCALSHKRMVWGHQNTYAAALHWNNYLTTLRNSAKHFADRYLEIRYEDLLLSPGTSMQALERFVTGKAGLITHQFVSEQSVLKRDKVGAWRKVMSPHAQTVFETVAGDMLQAYGYPLIGVECAISPIYKIGCLTHDRIIRESWYFARKVFPSISEYK